MCLAKLGQYYTLSEYIKQHSFSYQGTCIFLLAVPLLMATHRPDLPTAPTSLSGVIIGHFISRQSPHEHIGGKLLTVFPAPYDSLFAGAAGIDGLG